MKRVLPLLLLVVSQLAQAQWVEAQKGELVIRGGWLFDSVSDERQPNSGIVFLANGVTSTWSAGEYYPERVIAQRDRIDAGESIGPRLFASGPYFGAFRCEYNIKTAADECIGWPNDIKAARNIRFVIRDGMVHDPEALLRSAEGKIGPVGPEDHAEWELEIRPLRRDPAPLSP